MTKKIVAMVVAALTIAVMAGCGVMAGTNGPGVDVTQREEATPTATASAEATATPAATPVVSALPTPTMTPVASPTPAPTPTPKPTPRPNPPAVNERKLVYSNDYINVNVRYPEISGMADTAQQSGINTGISVYLKDMVNDIESRSRQAAASGSGGIYSIESKYEIKRNDGGILSVFVSISYYGGGADTGSDAAVINVINGNPAQQPTLADLFTSGTDYITVLNDKIKALIAADSNADSFTFESVSPTQWYYLTDKKLVVVFPRYSITAGTFGQPEFSIPLADLSGMLIGGIAN